MKQTDVEIWRLPEVTRRTGLSKNGVYRKMQRKEFPLSRRLGERAVGWRSDEVQDWIHSRPVAEPH